MIGRPLSCAFAALVIAAPLAAQKAPVDFSFDLQDLVLRPVSGGARATH